MIITIDTEQGKVLVENETGKKAYDIGSSEAFSYISQTWLRSGWDNKYVYGFSWLGRPIIQLPEDMIRIQELIYSIKPDVIIETGVAHGGSCIFYAGLCKAIGKGRVVGIDVEIRPHNRKAIEEHQMFEYITLIEGNSVDSTIVQEVHSLVDKGETVLLILDSNHTKDHVTKELEAYSSLVSVNSYAVVCDGIMSSLVGAPRSEEDWVWNNPKAAAEKFVERDLRFVLEEPVFPFNEGNIKERVTYWPSAYLKRLN
ncbi:hydroxylase [Paenibacillus sp. LMG 31461]|uniref:Hydroxylase n=1 Tax=Paenibacillus plantarum TaxID=2654975 RepID=A0ABX1XF07_9BACL|nr:CmcI family methyltransferase [Paenibacillus plantarum]NOU66741.1 hydroxylase [Paenibacillus plantarum]